MTTASRVQLALNVTDVDDAVEHYAAMFGVRPHKRRPGYANFEVADPPLKLVLFEQPDADSALNHLGVELGTPDDVAAATRRFDAAGLTIRTSEAELCCHAVQDKVYVASSDVPEGEWEFYTVVDDEPAPTAQARRICCEHPDGTAASCC